MNFKITKASDWNFEEENVEINNLDELKSLQEKYATPENEYGRKNTPSLIINFNNMSILIYDDYIE